MSHPILITMDSFVYIPGVGSIPGVQTELINFNFGIVDPQVNSIGSSYWEFTSGQCSWCYTWTSGGTLTTGYYSNEYIVKSFSAEPLQIMGIDTSGKPTIKGNSTLNCGRIEASSSYGNDWYTLPNNVRGRFKDNKLIVVAVGTRVSDDYDCGHSSTSGPGSVNLAGSFFVIS